MIALATTLLAASPCYTVLLGGRPSGTLCETRQGQSRHYTYEYVDRGRGPKLVEDVTLDDAGLPTATVIGGTDYYKNPVNERFENGGKGFYLARDGVPLEEALLATAAKKAGGSIALVPEGK